MTTERITAAAESLPEPLRALYALWSGLCSAARLPARADFPIATLKPWLGHLALLDIGAGTYRFRLCGTELIPRFTREATGLAVETLPPAIRGGLRTTLETARESKTATVASAQIDFESRCTEYRDLVLPLFDGEVVAALLLGSYAVRQVRP